jgi:undecaprenyl-phosphate galactose phosphotransferase
VLKRSIDISLCAIAVILFLPIFMLASMLIKLDGGPVFFTQERVGRGDRLFKMIKFRTMIPDAHETEAELRQTHASQGGYGTQSKYSDPRITGIGHLLRLTNLDELPQLLNILKGDMSLVGPRPVPYEESLLYGNERSAVLSVRPGLTGYWQIKRRMTMSYEQRVQLDSYYVASRSLALDTYILLMTGMVCASV